MAKLDSRNDPINRESRGPRSNMINGNVAEESLDTLKRKIADLKSAAKDLKQDSPERVKMENMIKQIQGQINHAMEQRGYGSK